MIARGRTAGLLALLAVVGAPAAAQQADVAARFNGTWEWRVGNMDPYGASGQFRIWALDDRRLQVEFDGLFATKTGIGRTANTGSAIGVALVQQGEARFKSEGSDCWFVLRLHGDRMVVNQSGYTCFGSNVTAEGTYHRVSTDRPAFAAPADAERAVDPPGDDKSRLPPAAGSPGSWRARHDDGSMPPVWGAAAGPERVRVDSSLGARDFRRRRWGAAPPSE